MSKFKGRHCGQDFEGPEGAKAWVEHFRVAHKRHQDKPGSDVNGRFMGRGFGPAPGWGNGQVLEPFAWETPRPVRGGLEKLAEKLEAGKYDLVFPFAGGTHRETVRMGELVAA